MKNTCKTFDDLVEQLEQIPSIGKKSASKIAYTLAVENKILALNIIQKLENAVSKIGLCEICNGICDNYICEICENEGRLYSGKLCIVSSPRDILTIESSKIYDGIYLAIDDIKSVDFSKIIDNIKQYSIKEVIFAFSPSLASDTMILFIEDKLKGYDLKFYKIAQGVPTGVGLENVDTLSLIRAMESRVEV